MKRADRDELQREIEMHVEKYCCHGCGPKARSCGRLQASEVAAELIEVFEREMQKQLDELPRDF